MLRPYMRRDHGVALPIAAIAGGLALLAAATAAMLQRLEPFTTWYYVFAWYSTLLALDGVVALSRGRFLLFGRPKHFATMLGWSAVLWLFYELLNLRLENWYYVFVPDAPLARWVGITVSFATVIPAVFAAEAVLRALGLARGARWPGLRITPASLGALQAVGALYLGLAMLWPKTFFPLVWGVGTLVIEPINYRRDPERSLLGDLERGRPGRLLRLLAGGAAIGLLWELYNFQARGKWIYTVPGLEQLKLFEMPLLGFLGFPAFALDCFAIWQALVLGGVAVARKGRALPASTTRRAGAAVAAVLFSAAVFVGMQRQTISSTTPRLGGLPGGVPETALRRAGYDVFSLAEASREAVARVPGVDAARASEWVAAARLAALRGIGTEHARELWTLGVRSVAELATRDPERLAEQLERLRGEDVIEARIRVWVRAAREARENDEAREL